MKKMSLSNWPADVGLLSKFVKVTCTEFVDVTKVADALTSPSATLAPTGVVKVTVFE